VRNICLAVLRWLPVVAAVALVVAPVRAQAWPERNVTILVPFAAGSTPDLIARVLADGLQPRLGKTFVVENRPGASGNTATSAVAKAVPDGYTLGVSIVGPLVINPLIMSTVNYDPDKEIAPISIVASQPSILAVNPALGATSVASLLDALKTNPGKYNYGSIGKGSLSHLSMEALLATSGTRAVHVVFPGSPAAMTALIRGDVQMSILPAGAVVAQAQDGKVAMLAVTTAKRSPVLPTLPTMAESGVRGVEADAWVGLIAPANTPEPIRASLLQSVRAALAEPQAAARLKPAFMVPVIGSPAEFRSVLAQERSRWEPVVKAGQIRAD
jgi:tripartite-type tricarboxylate transporter receptor subunit TctC